MYSLQKGETATVTAYIVNMKRLDNSFYGNPQFEIGFAYDKDATVSDFTAKTKVDSMTAYKASLYSQYELTICKPRVNLYVDEMNEVR